MIDSKKHKNVTLKLRNVNNYYFLIASLRLLKCQASFR